MKATLTVAAALVAVVVTGASGAPAADPSFAPRVVAGLRPCTVAAADFNDDGKVDLAVLDCASNAVTALLGDGNGGFRAAVGSPIRVTEGVPSLLAVDLNRDAKPDLAVLGDGQVHVLLGDGTGRFAPAPGSPLMVAAPRSMTAADLNGDRTIDLAVASRPSRSTRIVSLLGDGSGRFAPSTRGPLSIGAFSASSQATGDFNGDAKPDLAFGLLGEPKTVVALGDGVGGFRNVTTARPGLLGVGDFNGDGRADLAGATKVRGQLRVSVLRWSGSGGFRPFGPAAIVGPVHAVGAVADVDGDRRLDLLVGNANQISVMRGNGAGRLRHVADSPFALPAAPFFPGSTPWELVAADFTGDARPDLAVPAGRWGLVILVRTPSAPPVAPGGRLGGRRAAVYATRGPIGALAVDGKRAVVATGAARGSCGRIVVWTAPSRSARTFRTREGCDSGTIPYHVVDVAVGGGQVAWLGEAGGNSLDMLIHVAKLSGGRPRQIELVNNSNGATGSPEGSWIGELEGGGPLLVYNRWRVVCTVPPDYGCSWYEPTLRLAEQRLIRVVAGRRVAVQRGSDSYPVTAVGGGRMAVPSGDAVTVLGPRGNRVAVVRPPEGDRLRASALSRMRLAVERTHELDLHDPASGAKAKSIALGPAAALRLAGVNSRLALLSGSRRLVLVRLSDGKLISLPYHGGMATAVVGAKLSEAGLFYAYNVPGAKAKGRIVFEPTAGLIRRF